jgi:hypothetical protein
MLYGACMDPLFGNVTYVAAGGELIRSYSSHINTVLLLTHGSRMRIRYIE